MNKPLMDYLPQIWHDIGDFKTLYAQGDNTLSYTENDIEQQNANQYPTEYNVNASGVERWWEALNLSGDGLTTDEKLYRIRAALLDNRPYNRKNLIASLNQLVGADNFALSIDDAQQIIAITLAESAQNNIDTVIAYVDKILPAAMAISVDYFNRYGDLSAIEMTHAAAAKYTQSQLRSDITWRQS